MNYFPNIVKILLLIICSFSFVYAQSGSVAGVLKDAQTGEALVSANIYIIGTALGTTSDIDGNYKLVDIPSGKDTIVFRYIGYKTFQTVINVPAGRTLQFNVKLSPTTITGKEVIVTAQLSGQTKAINQQLSSNTIVNVVSSDKIQELPDRNVAESIGRLPGISIQREAGEGQKVVIRGLSPKFNSITINGVKVPATDPNDRSVDLSMISSDMLAGIEVFKAQTADQDADAIGGTVNLELRKAHPGLHYDVKVQDGYNAHVSKYGQYKGDFDISDRFFDDKLGVFATVTGQRVDRSSDQLTADYNYASNSGANQSPVIETENLNLADNLQIRRRVGGSVSIDYDLGNGSIVYNAFYSKSDIDRVRRRKRYRVGNFTEEYDMLNEKTSTTLLSNSLSGNHNFNNLILDWEISDAKSTSETPFSDYARFIEVGAFNNGLDANQGVDNITPYAKNDLSSTWFQYGSFDPQVVDDRNLTAQINAKLLFNIGQDVSGFLKFGGKFRGKKRLRNIDEYLTDYGVVDHIGQANPNKFALYRGTNILISNFLDKDFSADNFLNGRFEFGPGLDVGAINNFYETYKSNYEFNRFVQLGDYTASENINAGYLMGQINIGKQLMILPGIRVEVTANSYKGLIGILLGNLGQDGSIRDTVGGHSYTELFPMLQVRYKLTSEFDVRASVSRSLSRPDYYNLVPYLSINKAENIINEGNPDLKHAIALNYDLYFSLYNNYGLFTLGLFYKDIKDIDYISQSRVQGGGDFNGYQLITSVNADKSKVYGFELDLQTHFTFLPSPLDGIVLGANYSRMNSETYFPYFEIGPRSPNPPYAPTIINGFRKGRMPGQADNIANLSIGYEKGRFSGRVSMIYQGKSLQSVGTISQLDGFTDAYTRWDAQISYDIYDGFKIYTSFNNITNLSEGAFLGSERFPTNQEYFGWTGDLGIRYTF